MTAAIKTQTLTPLLFARDTGIMPDFGSALFIATVVGATLLFFEPGIGEAG